MNREKEKEFKSMFNCMKFKYSSFLINFLFQSITVFDGR